MVPFFILWLSVVSSSLIFYPTSWQIWTICHILSLSLALFSRLQWFTSSSGAWRVPKWLEPPNMLRAFAMSILLLVQHIISWLTSGGEIAIRYVQSNEVERFSWVICLVLVMWDLVLFYVQFQFPCRVIILHLFSHLWNSSLFVVRSKPHVRKYSIQVSLKDDPEDPTPTVQKMQIAEPANLYGSSTPRWTAQQPSISTSTPTSTSYNTSGQTSLFDQLKQ